MSNFFVMIRRLVLLYMAMFVAQYSWLQVMTFSLLSLLYIAYLGYTHPHKSRKENRLGLFNEQITCIVSYEVIVLTGLCNEATQYQSVGDLIVWTLYVCWGVNGVIIGISMIIELRRLLRRWYRKIKNRFCKSNISKASRYEEKRNGGSESSLAASAFFESARRHEISIIQE